MNKTELVAAVAEQADISKKDAEKVLKNDSATSDDINNAIKDLTGLKVDIENNDINIFIKVIIDIKRTNTTFFTIF